MGKTQKRAFKAKKSIIIDGEKYYYYSLAALQKEFGDIGRLPRIIKILLENLLRSDASVQDIESLIFWHENKKSSHEIAFYPSRLLMSHSTGIPAMLDMAAMREAAVDIGGKAGTINPLIPVDIVVNNVTHKFERNIERYSFLKWAQSAFKNLRVVPPGAGVCDRINIEHLSQIISIDESSSKNRFIYPETAISTDMDVMTNNALSVIGKSVGGMEARCAMFARPLSMPIPEIIGVRTIGAVQQGVDAIDIAVHMEKMLIDHGGAIGKFLEFYDQGLDHLSIKERAAIAGISSAHGVSCAFFPVDEQMLDYLRATGRGSHHIEIVKAYAKAQGLWRSGDEKEDEKEDEKASDPEFFDILHFDLSEVSPASFQERNDFNERLEVIELSESDPEIFTQLYRDIMLGPVAWRTLGGECGDCAQNDVYRWQENSTYIRKPPFFDAIARETPAFENIRNAYALVVLEDSVTSENISPLGEIKPNSPAGDYLAARRIESEDFGTYCAHSGNYQVMLRGLFSDEKLKNKMTPEEQGGYTKHIPSGEKMSVYDAAMRYQTDRQPLVIIAGTGYGAGNAHEWAVKGLKLLGVRAVIAQSFERTHRAELVKAGILPLQFMNNLTCTNLNLTGDENYTITEIAEDMSPKKEITMSITYANGNERTINLLCRVDNADELEYYRHESAMHHILREMMD